MDHVIEDVQKVLFTSEQIRRRVEELGALITADYQHRKPLVIGILKGGAVFMSDLIREIRLPINIDFMAVSSYGRETVSSGHLIIRKDLDEDVRGRHVLIVEDLVDTGRTLSYLKKELERRGAADVRICAMMDKPERREADISIDYLGFEAADEFIIGYGCDYAERYRNLPYIAALKREIYETE